MCDTHHNHDIEPHKGLEHEGHDVEHKAWSRRSFIQALGIDLRSRIRWNARNTAAMNQAMFSASFGLVASSEI